MSAEKAVLLLGRRDQPTDGVADYCERLREAALQFGIDFELVTVPWAEKGWRGALAELRKAAAGWSGRWVLLQFTTLAWSRRGFPLRAPRVLEILRRCGARPGVVFHDISPLPASGMVGNIREFCQQRVFHRLYSCSDLAIFTAPINKVLWLPLRREKAVFLPIGANCPEMGRAPHGEASSSKTVAVYSVTGGRHIMSEVADLSFALRNACQSAGLIRVVLFGRGSREALPSLQSALSGASVEIECFGIVPPAKVSRLLSLAEVLLFVRGQISSRRGTAIAGIACGLPIVCYSGPETGWPITEAGILTVPLGDREALAAGLSRVLSDDVFRAALGERSRLAQEKYFSWAAIAEQFAVILRPALSKRDEDRTESSCGAVRIA